MSQDFDFTELMQRAVNDQNAKDKLYDYVYEELRRAAHQLLRHNPPRNLQTTDLVNEVFLRIEKADALKKFANRKVFFSVTTQAMKQILTDNYRRQKKRLENGPVALEPLDAVVKRIEEESEFDFDALTRELDRLEQDSPRQHSVIMHRFFGGLSVAQTAELLNVSQRSVERDWRLARAKLFMRLKKDIAVEE